MAHYSVTVCLPPEAATDLDAALATALAPFGEAATELDWDFGALWDNWRIAGSSDHFGFWIRPGCTDDPRLIHDGPDWRTGAPRLSVPGMCAGGPRGLIDLSEEPELPRALAMEAWEVWHRLSEQYPRALPMVFIRRRIQPDPRQPADEDLVRAEYEAQPLIQAFKAAHPFGGLDPQRYSSEIHFMPGDRSPWGQTQTAEGFAYRVVDQCLGGGDLLTLDGWWIESDGAAHHGTCGSGCPHRPEAFNDARGNANITTGRWRYLEATPPDTLLVRIHGHC